MGVKWLAYRVSLFVCLWSSEPYVISPICPLKVFFF